ncbi:hypothetical protein EV426DRAFT_336465 [Tirmania nivea]|nr:hypothetical protein EV426DRAFT_336465 [Tirmania nivea]
MLSCKISGLCTLLLLAASVAALPPPAVSEAARAPSLPALDGEALALHRTREEKKNPGSGEVSGAEQCNSDHGCIYPYSLCCMAVEPPTCCPWYARYCSMDGKECIW